MVFLCECSQYVMLNMSDVYIMFGSTYGSEILACHVFTRTNFLVSRFQRNNFELYHCLGEGETFTYAAAEHRRQDANQLRPAHRVLQLHTIGLLSIYYVLHEQLLYS